MKSFLFTNGTLDLVTSMVLASTYGIGIAIAAVVLFLWQGGIYLGASFLTEFISDPFMTELSIVGGFLIAASGISILKIKDFKTMNRAVPAGPCDLFLRKKSDRLTATRSTRTPRHRQPSKVPQLQSKG